MPVFYGRIDRYDVRFDVQIVVVVAMVAGCMKNQPPAQRLEIVFSFHPTLQRTTDQHLHIERTLRHYSDENEANQMRAVLRKAANTPTTLAKVNRSLIKHIDLTLASTTARTINSHKIRPAPVPPSKLCTNVSSINR